MADIWMPVIGFEGRYEVSELGQIRSLYFSRGLRRIPRHLKPKIKNNGYLFVSLCDGSGLKPSYRHVHRIVLEAFSGKPPEGFVCAHLDGDQSNNRLSNLKWSTQKENHSHKHLHGTRLFGNRCHMAKLNPDEVREIRRLNTEGGLSAYRISKHFGVEPAAIRAILIGRTWREVV